MSKRKTHEEFKKEVKEKHPNIELLSEYINAKTKIICRCNICGYIWEIIPYNLLKGYGCYECTKLKMRERLIKSTEQFKQELYKVNPNIEITSEYKGNKIPIGCKCKIDGHEFKSNPINLLRNHGCPLCGVNRAKKLMAKSHDEFIYELNIKNPNIKVLSEYINMKTKVKCKCEICGCTWKAIPDNLLRDRGCPSCSSSKGERKIIEYMDNLNISYKHDISYFKDLIGVNNGLMRPDFIIPDKKIWIEFDGVQHFELTDFAGKGKEWAEEQFKITKENDKLKDEYAKEHGWKLIRIPYWDYDEIENILDKILNKN